MLKDSQKKNLSTTALPVKTIDGPVTPLSRTFLKGLISYRENTEL